MTRSFLTTTDLATICEVDLKTIHNWADKGKIEHFRTPGRHLRFEREHVVKFLKHFGYPVPKDLQDASTPAEKRVVIERIHAAWCAVPGMRLGELIASSCHEADCYYSDDTTLAELCEAFAKEGKR